METNRCPQCGAPVSPDATECEYCGEKLTPSEKRAQTAYTQQPQPQVVYVREKAPENDYRSSWPVKSKLAAGLLAIFLGGLGIHKFYLGKTGMGVLYLLFSWTGIPEIVGFIEGIVYLCSNDENFQLKYHVRLE